MHDPRLPFWTSFAVGALAVWTFLASGAGCAAEPEKGPPNIVFVLADDLGINDLSCYGRRDQPTPHIDKLAEQGARFTTAYAQPVCSPTRASLLTGKSAARLHITTFLPGRADAASQLLLSPKIALQLPAEEKTIAARLKRAGYASACIGKWHLGGKGALPTDFGFDQYFPGHANTKPSDTEGGKGEYELTDRAEKFIEENKDGFFFLYLCHNNPHVPLAAKPELIEKHKDAFNPTYAAMVETLDDSVGRVVAKLDALGLTDRTLFVFMSDNGGLHVPEGDHTPSTRNTPFRGGKGFCYEGGIRVPLIVRWPGKVKAGIVVEDPIHCTDWAPTFAELTGAAGEGFDGVSLLPVLARGEAPAPRPLFWHMPHYTNQGGRPSGAIRLDAWKLIEHYEDGRCELFDLKRDPGESDDLSAKEPGRVADLRGKLEKWRRDSGAQENTANPKFNGKAWQAIYQPVDISRLPDAATAAELAAKLKDWRTLMNAAPPGAGPDAKPGVAAGPGAVLLHARDAKVHGAKLHYEPEPHKDTLGFWTQRDDWAEWEFEAPGAGVFEVEVLQGCGKGSGGSEIEVTVHEQTLTFKVEETGHFQRFVPRRIGSVKFEKAGRYTLMLKAKSKPGAAVMDLRSIVLRAAGE